MTATAKDEVSHPTTSCFDHAVGPFNPDEIPISKVFLMLVEYKVKPGQALDFCEGMDSTQGRFYRSQPGCIVYTMGVCAENPNVVLGLVIWSSKELFDALPKDPHDLDKLNAARLPYRDMLDGDEAPATRITMSSLTIDAEKHLPLPVSEEAAATWDLTMKDVHNPPTNALFMTVAELAVKPGQAVLAAKGLDATTGRFYRHQSECLLYLFGIDDSSSKVLAATVWSSQEAFYKQPHHADDLVKLEHARAPYCALLDDSIPDTRRARSTKVMVGSIFGKEVA